MEKLLKMLEFSDEEIKEQMPRIEKALERAKITEEDIERGKEIFTNYYEMRATRKIMGLWLKRFVDLMLWKDEKKKAIYHIHLGVPRYNILMHYAHPEIYSDFIDSVILYGTGGIFGNPKSNYFLEVAEANGMEQTQAQCSMNQMAYGALVSGFLPVPDLYVGGRQQCDQSAKLLELATEITGAPFATFDTCRDEAWGTFPEILDRPVNYWAKQMDRCFKDSERILGIEAPSVDQWRQARKDYAIMWLLFSNIFDTYIAAEGRPDHTENLQPMRWAVLEPHGHYMDEYKAAFQLYNQELKDKIAKGQYVLDKDVPRVSSVCGPNLIDPTLSRVWEECGLNLVIPASAEWIAPWELAGGAHKYPDFLQRIGESYIKKGYVRCGYDHIYRFLEMTKVARLDGVVVAPQFSCRILAAPAYYLKEALEREGIPAMVLEQDPFDPRVHTAEALRTRLEAFSEMVRSRKRKKVSV